MRYRFGTFELDGDQYELRQGARVVRVEPRVLDVLFFLVRNRDRVVSREELLDTVWKTKFIGESALSRSIMQARKAVTATGGGEVEEPIKTIHRRGYRFVAPVIEEDGTGAERETRPTAPSATGVDAEAAKLCARARQLWKKRSPEGMRTAIALLQDAIEIEPDYAPAHATLGDCFTFVGFLQQTPPMSVFPKAEAAIARALELDPGLAEAHGCRGFIETVYRWNPVAAREALAEAIRLDPGSAIVHHRLGMHLLAQRRFSEADAALRHAAVLDPLSPIFDTACGLPATARGDAETAIGIYRTVIESEPNFFPVHFYLGLALESAGRLDEAIAELRIAVDITPNETEALPALGHALARAGRADEAREIAERVRTAASHRFISPFFFAVLAMGVDDHETALERLSDAVDIRAMRMHDLHLDPRFAPLRSDERFTRLLQRIGVDPDVTERQEPRWWASRRS
jgi:DNA-binding winged helix-turn-helix (wHTH) protein/tetratricopeptide (TPR) repeat protein